MNPPIFPPVEPLPTLDPWRVPQTLVARPREITPQAGPVVAARFLGGGTGTAMPVDNAAPIRDPHRYARLAGSAGFPVGTAAVLVLASPPTYRNMLIVRNTGASNIYLDFGIEADATRSPIRLIPNAMLIFDDVVPQDDVFAVGDAAVGSIGISYSNVNYNAPPGAGI